MDDIPFFAGLAAVVLVLIGLLGFGAYTMERIGCEAKWEHSGFQVQFGAWSSCTISKDGKTWIPAENYREIP